MIAQEVLDRKKAKLQEMVLEELEVDNLPANNVDWDLWTRRFIVSFDRAVKAVADEIRAQQ